MLEHLGEAKLFIYPVKVTVYIKNLMIHKHLLGNLNKLCSQVLYQCFIHGL